MKHALTAKNIVSEKPPITFVVARKRESVAPLKGTPAFSWLHLLTLLVVTTGLLIPQVRNFFILSGCRWAYVLTVSFAVSFSLNPLCSWMGKNHINFISKHKGWFGGIDTIEQVGRMVVLFDSYN